MDIYKLVEVDDCPLCDGASILEEEGNSYYVMCMECGAHSVSMNYKGEEDRLETAKKVAELWNKGKVIKPNPGE